MDKPTPSGADDGAGDSSPKAVKVCAFLQVAGLSWNSSKIGSLEAELSMGYPALLEALHDKFGNNLRDGDPDVANWQVGDRLDSEAGTVAELLLEEGNYAVVILTCKSARELKEERERAERIRETREEAISDAAEHGSVLEDMFSSKGSNGVLSFGQANMKGRRAKMEDDHFAEPAFVEGPTPQSLFGVFDGHGGWQASFACAKFIPTNLKKHPLFPDNPEAALKEVIALEDEVLCQRAKGNKELETVGTTAVVVLVRGRTLWCANVGDSRCVLSRNGVAVALSEDHKPDSEAERKRIEAAGGSVKFGRVNGILGMSRAIGDADLKAFVPPSPDVVRLNIKRKSNEFVVLATDGLWDKMSNQEVVDHVRSRPGLMACPEKAARALVAEAYRRESLDNISVVVVFLRAAP